MNRWKSLTVFFFTFFSKRCRLFSQNSTEHNGQKYSKKLQFYDCTLKLYFVAYCMYVRVYVYLLVYACTYVCICVYMYFVCMYVCVIDWQHQHLFLHIRFSNFSSVITYTALIISIIWWVESGIVIYAARSQQHVLLICSWPFTTCLVDMPNSHSHKSQSLILARVDY